MISYADFEFAIARWKARMTGAPAPSSQVVSGMVESAVPVATSVHDMSTPVPERRPVATSGSIVISDSLMDPPEK